MILVFSTFWYRPRSGFVGTCGDSAMEFLRTCASLSTRVEKMRIYSKGKIEWAVKKQARQQGLPVEAG